MAETMIDSDAFRAYELAGWQGAVEAYNDHFWSLTSQTIGPLLDAVKELREREGCFARSRRHPSMRFAQKFRTRRRVTIKTGFFRYQCPLLLRRQ